MFIPLLLFCIIAHVAHSGDECEPGFADTCFSAVLKDLQYMINVRKMTELNVTQSSLRELCLALDDSFNCTYDIIEEDCTEDDGRDSFDAWLRAFRAVHRFLCDGPDHKGLADILHGISCWSVEDFIMCTEEKADLRSFWHILHSEFDDIECQYLHNAMLVCRKYSVVGSCREQDYVFKAVDRMINAFFVASKCENFKDSETYFRSIGASLFPLLETILTLMLLTFVL